MNMTRDGAWEIFDAAPEMMAVIGFGGTMQRANPAFRERFRLGEGDLDVHAFLTMLHPDDRAASIVAFEKLWQEGRHPPVRNRYILPDGELLWVEWRTVLLPDGESLLSVARDVTRQELDAEISRSNQSLAFKVNQALADYVAGTSGPNGPVEVLLAEALRLTTSEYGFIGEVLHDASGVPYLKTHAITNIAWNEETSNFYEQNVAQGLEFRNLETLFGRVMVSGKPVIANDPGRDPRRGGLPPGHPAMHAFVGQPIYSGDSLVGMIGLANAPGGYDLDTFGSRALFLSLCCNLILAFRAERERRTAVARLQQAEARYRVLVETIKEGIFLLDAAQHIDFCNPSMCALLGLEQQELIGRELISLVVTEDSEKVAAALGSLEGEGSADLWLETHMRLTDNGFIPVELGLARARIGDDTRIIGVLRDVSAEKSVRDQLIRARQLAEGANKAKSDFLANMSHEIRTPLNGMIGMLELAQGTSLNELQRDYVDTSLDASRNLLYLVNDMLDFARIEAGKLALDIRQFGLSEHLEYCVQHFESAAAQKGLRLGLQLAAGTPGFLFGDPQRLRQILLNLVSNAIKFTSQGSVDILVECLQRSQDTVTLRFSVRDTGIGIPPDNQAGIFDAFEQVDPSITRRYGGTGLGLSISRALVSMMNGRISLDSTEGKGSVFWFELPLRVGESTSSVSAGSDVDSRVAPASLPKAPDWRPLRVLVAEDNTVNQRLFRYTLEERGHTVMIAGNGLDAVAAWQQGQFEVILMDVQMPELDGLEACRRIRAAQSAAGGSVHQRIIALTAHAMSGDRDRCIEAGMDSYLSKPISNIELYRAIES